MPATVFEVDVKTRSTAEPGIRQRIFTNLLFAMALLAYMPTAACVVPAGTGEATDPMKELGPAP
jgi:hypothetical protein